MFKNVVITSALKLYRMLPADHRKTAIWILFILTLNSILDFISLGVLIPVIPLVLQPDIVHTNAYLQQAFDALGFESERNFITFLFGFVVVFFILKNLLSIWISARAAKFSFNLFQHFSRAIHESYFQRGLLFLQDLGSVEAVRDISLLPLRLSENLVMPLIIVFTEVVVIAILALSILAYNPASIFFILLVIGLPFVVFYSWAKNKTQQSHEEAYALANQLQKNLQESINAYIEIKTTNTEKSFFQRYTALTSQYANVTKKNVILTLLPSKLLEVSFIAGCFVLVVFALYQAEGPDRLTLFGIYALSAYRLLPSINRISMGMMNIQGHQYVFSITDKISSHSKPAFADESRSIVFNHEILLKDVSFRYPTKEKDIFTNFTLSIRKGDCLGIVGTSGAGKSTLLNLIIGCYTPTAGKVTVDGQALNPENLDSWCHMIGYVPQEVYLLNATIRENITMDLDPAKTNAERLTLAINVSGIESIVGNLSQGIDSLVGERGTKLSIGQKQRIGIARAIYFGAQVLILDEITSALDVKTEYEVTESIGRLAKEHMTCIIVAHRLTTLRYCTRIIEIENGTGFKEYDYASLSSQHDQLMKIRAV